MIRMRLWIVILCVIAGYVWANGEEYYGEEYYEEEEEGTEGLGSAAAWLLFLGLLHPLFKYLAPRFGMEVSRISRIRARTLVYHALAMAASTLLALAHHFTSEMDVLAYPALVLMVLLSTTGAIMKLSLHPGTSRYASMIHFQRIFTAVLLVSLFLHLSVGGE